MQIINFTYETYSVNNILTLMDVTSGVFQLDMSPSNVGAFLNMT